MEKKLHKKSTFLGSLRQLLRDTKEMKKIKIEKIFGVLSGRGYAALLIVFSLPFCLPIQIPGFSTPFGLLLALLGLRIAFSKKLWWPKWILKKSFPRPRIHALVRKTMKVIKKMQKILKPRLTLFTKSSFFVRMNGLLVFILGLFLSLPLPIPMTNLLSAFPILCMGLGILEDDGIFILISYFLTLLCLSAFVTLFLLGKAHLTHLFS